jgi:hypothetical protein
VGRHPARFCFFAIGDIVSPWSVWAGRHPARFCFFAIGDVVSPWSVRVGRHPARFCFLALGDIVSPCSGARRALSEGLPVPREPAYAAKRSQDGEAPAASERAEATMAEASARRRGTGSPEPRGGPAAGPHRSRDGGFLGGERPATGHRQPRAARQAGRRSASLTRWRLPGAGGFRSGVVPRNLATSSSQPTDPPPGACPRWPRAP